MSSREQQPRGRKERSFIVIPFSSTCRSASSVDVVKSNNKPLPQGASAGDMSSAGGGERKPPGKSESLSLVARLLRGFKNLSHQIFAVHDEEDEDEEEQEMVIGLPTDVKHVAHIGWDGSTSTTTSLRSWNRAAPPPPDAASTSSSSAAAPPPPAQEPTLSVRQFELAMAAQASAAGTGATAAAASTSSSGTGATSSTARRHRHYS